MVSRVVASCLVVAACALSDNAPEEEPAYADGDQIRLLLSILDSPDEVERNAAFHRLMAIGRPVLPYLEQRLRLRAGDAYVDLLRGLAVLPEPAAAVPAKENPEEPQAAQGKADPNEVAKYIMDKLVAAREYLERGQYERAYALAEGVLSVEPNHSLRSEFQKLKVVAQQRITETKLVKPSLTSRQDVYRTTDRIDLTFRLDDVTPGPVDLDFTGTLSGLSRAPKNGQNFLHADITITEYTPYGDSRSWNRTQTWELKENAHLTPAAPWIFPTTLDISGDQAAAHLYRTYTIHAELRPYLFRTPEGDLRGRRIQFPPLTIGVFPLAKDLELIRAQGLEILSELLDAGASGARVDPNLVFLTCLLLSKEDQPKAVNLLMNVLAHPRTSDLDKQLILTCLHQITRLPLERCEDAWLDWWEREQAVNPSPR